MRPFVCLLGVLLVMSMALFSPTVATAHEYDGQATATQLAGVTFTTLDLALDRAIAVGDGHYVSWGGPVQKYESPCQKRERRCENIDKCQRHPLNTICRHTKNAVAAAVTWRPLRRKCRGCRGRCC